MPCDYTELERGAVCLALYPFQASFPLERLVRNAENELLAQLETVTAIDEIESTISAGDPPSELVARFKLRRVLILHDGTSSAIQSVAVARISSVKQDRKSTRAGWWRKLENGAHPTSLLIGRDARHGTNRLEAYVDTANVAFIPKSSVLRRTGQLDEDEMRQIGLRLITSLGIALPELNQPAPEELT